MLAYKTRSAVHRDVVVIKSCSVLLPLDVKHKVCVKNKELNLYCITKEQSDDNNMQQTNRVACRTLSIHRCVSTPTRVCCETFAAPCTATLCSPIWLPRSPSLTRSPTSAVQSYTAH